MPADQQYDEPFLPNEMPLPAGYRIGPDGYPVPDVPSDVKFVDPPPGYPAEMRADPEPPAPPAQPEPPVQEAPSPLPGFIPRPEDTPQPHVEQWPENDDVIDAVDDTVHDSTIIAEGEVAMGGGLGGLGDIANVYKDAMAKHLAERDPDAPQAEAVTEAVQETAEKTSGLFQKFGETLHNLTEKMEASIEARQSQQAETQPDDDVYEAAPAEVHEAETVDTAADDPADDPYDTTEQ